jgi:hypothetical protein
MAIKIDLLPAYVGLRRWFKRALIASAALVAAIGAILFLLHYKGQQQLAKLNQELQGVETNARATEAAETAKTAAETAAAPLQAFSDFVVAAGKTGAERAALLDMVRRYIYGGAVVSAIDISNGQTVRLSATMTTPDDYARFLLNLRRGSASNGGPLFAAEPRTNSVRSTGVPGGPTRAFVAPGPGPTARTIQFPLQISAEGTLKDPVVVPTETGAGGSAAPGGGPGGPPGGPPM